MAKVQSDGIFVSCTLPDIDPKSHIIGLVGIHDHQEQAKPQKDGWFLSDFYMFNHLFSGLCATRAWFTCLKPEMLVKKYDQYAHGNPFQTRYLVLDKEKLESDDRPKDLVIVEDAALLLQEFVKYLKAECERAHAAGEPVLLFLFGHGDGETHGIEIGRLSNGDKPLLSMEVIMEVLRTFPGLRMSVLLTSCYSGGWTTHLNMTAMTAAGAENVSESWPESHSLGRATGSIFASAIVERLKKEEVAPDPDKDNSITYRQFCDEVKATLMLLDKFGADHNISFSAQEDDWESEFHSRTGIPRAVFGKRLDLLRTIPSTDREKHPYGDRTSEEQLEAWGQTPSNEPCQMSVLAKSMRGRHGGSQASIQSLMQNRASRYMASHPGRNSMADNRVVHALACQCIQGGCSFDELEQLAASLDYREKAMRVAELCIGVMNLEPFVPHWKWDHHDWLRRPDVKDFLSTPNSPFRQIVKAHLIPKPGPDEGQFWSKPVYYLCAAMHARGLGEAEIEEKIHLGRKC